MWALFTVDIGEVIISFSTNITETTRNLFTGTAGDNITLTCSVNITNVMQLDDVKFKWLFDSPQRSLPPDVTILNVTENGGTYNSTLHFSPLRLSHKGMYTCQLWNYTTQMASAMLTVNCKCQILTILNINNSTSFYLILYRSSYCQH